ncbi:hypothetical protein DUNSADRAFT_18295 [Dunaliella salina]|uniref:Elongation factor EFG domain-containing protein n=1 Tax=Dunaliella salina TaxID=3046 RepID=A0ABQ7G0B3_DUNSA|nr:hypothetical protein DUNSADRAFT_18295 [Dunaliella salina]|eukprot:KAF5828041.1 hypothetical protein DUNSADRAFT_18295 [Dunaliella salina]
MVRLVIARPESLTNALWGDWTISPKEKRVVRIKSKGAGSSKAKPLFVQLVLETVYKAYSACEVGEDQVAVLSPIIKARNLGHLVPTKALEHPDPKQALRAVMRAWLPLSEAVLGMAMMHLPAPLAAAPVRMPRLLGSSLSNQQLLAPSRVDVQPPPSMVAALKENEAALSASSASLDAPVIVYVSKMIAVPATLLPSRVSGAQAPVHTTAAGAERSPRSNHIKVSPPLVAFRESVLCPAEAADASAGGQTALAAAVARSAATRVVEAATPNGVLLVRVRASPLPASLAATLGDSPEAVKRAVQGVAAEGQGSSSTATDGAAAGASDSAAAGNGPQSKQGLLGAAGEEFRGACGQPSAAASHAESGRDGFGDGSVTDSTAEGGDSESGVVAARRAGQGVAGCSSSNGDGVGVGRSSSGSGGGGGGGGGSSNNELEALHSKVQAVVKEAGAKMEAMVARAWQLGPRGVGPCMLLTPQAPVEGRASRALGDTNGGRLASSRHTGAPLDTHEGVHSSSNQGSPAGAASASGSTVCGSLFDPLAVPGVVRVGRQGVVTGVAGGGASDKEGGVQGSQHGAQQRPPRSHAAHHPSSTPAGGEALPSTAALHDPQGAAQQQQQQQEQEDRQQCVDLRLGWPQAATALGLLEPSTAASARHWGSGGAAAVASGQLPPSWEPVAAAVESGVVAGFQWATSAGPLCEEPMWGVAFELDARLILPPPAPPTAQASRPREGGATTQQEDGEASSVNPVHAELQEDVYGPFSGQVMTAVAAACRRAVIEADPRLVEAMYLCQVQTTAEALSGTYAVLGRRRARILREEMREGSDTFLVHAYLPVEASFGLADEMRRRSSGAASASLLLSHWERLQVDPFFVPTTEEEREEHGEEGVGGHAANVARRLMDAVRRRKGLAVEEKVVKVATKQRTLKRNV